MKIVIIGSGELGRLLAEQLCGGNNDVTIIDPEGNSLEHLKDKFDLMTVEGSGTSVATLKNAGISGADILLAVSGDEAVNMVACRIAAQLGVKKSVCRLYSFDSFSEDESISPELFGIWRAFSSPLECVRKVLDVLESQDILEKIHFSNPDALMEVINVTKSSMLAGTRIKDLPCSDRLSSVRFAAIVRGKQFLVPHGDTILVPDDKLYIAGHRDNVNEFVKFMSDDTAPDTKRNVVISGASDIGLQLAETLLARGYELRYIEKNQKNGEMILDRLPRGLMVVAGDPTDEDVMQEAGVGGCDIFISTAEDDEENILACILAKRLGAGKAITITHKPEYIRIVPALEAIDCGFSSTLVSINTIFRLMETGNVRIDAKLQRFHAHLTEFKISKSSPVCGKKIMDCELPSSAVLAMLFRDNEVISPSGTTKLLPGDIIVTIVTPETASELEQIFPL